MKKKISIECLNYNMEFKKDDILVEVAHHILDIILAWCKI